MASGEINLYIYLPSWKKTADGSILRIVPSSILGSHIHVTHTHVYTRVKIDMCTQLVHVDAIAFCTRHAAGNVLRVTPVRIGNITGDSTPGITPRRRRLFLVRERSSPRLTPFSFFLSAKISHRVFYLIPDRKALGNNCESSSISIVYLSFTRMKNTACSNF